MKGVLMAVSVSEAVEAFLEADRTELKAFVDCFVDGAVNITSSKLGYFAAMNDAGDELIMLGWSRTAMKMCSIIDKPLRYPLEQTGVWGDCIREKGPVVINDYQNCERPTRKGYPSGHIHVVRHMNIPIWEDDRTVGILGVGTKEEDYTEEDIQSLQAYAQEVWDVVKQGVAHAV